MKKIGKILSLSIVMVLLSFPLCFASGLELVGSYPEEGSDYSMLENVVVKLEFSEDVSGSILQESNKGAFKFKDAAGKSYEVKPLYSEKRPNEIWVQIMGALEPAAEYKLSISGDLESASGDALGKDRVVAFKTRDTGADTTVNMLLMGLMVVGMIAFSSISMKRTMKKEAEQKGQVDKVNPYKMAKETGKSVEDIVAKTEKDKKKAQAKTAKNQTAKDKEEVQEEDNGNKKVKGARPISVSGSTFITGRKAEAERKAAEKAAANTTHPKKSTGKSKNTKKSK